MMDSSSSSSPNNKLMEKTNLLDPHHHQHQQQQQTPTPPPPPPSLKCPRCDSSNTKFCYYNNYSLSQPRHFCKACKRYWTRGGTLRNVPVGGGCRKNKKLRRPSSGGSGAGISAAAATANPSINTVRQQQMDLSSSQTSNYINSNPSSFYPLELNFPFSGYSNSTRVSSDNNNNTAGFDLQQQPQTMMNGLGLGFSSGFRQIQDNVMTSSSSSPFSSTGNYNSVLFGSSSAFASNTSTMASLLASTLQQQKFGISSTDPASNYEDNTQNRSWNQNNHIYEQIISNSSDPASSSSLVWNTTSNNNTGSWFDPSNMGSSVPSLI